MYSDDDEFSLQIRFFPVNIVLQRFNKSIESNYYVENANVLYAFMDYFEEAWI